MTREDESSLAKCVLNWADRGLALCKRTVKKHALDIIKSRGYDKDPVTKIWIKRGKMSRKWFRGFMRRHPELRARKNAWMDGDLYHYWVETVFLPYTEELRRRGKILLIIDNFRHTRVIAAECALTATLSAEESPGNPAHATFQGALQAAAGGQPEPKLPKKVTLQRAGAALETAAKAEEKKEQQVNKAEQEVANAKCRKTELAEAVAEAELSVLGAHVKVADAKIAAGQIQVRASAKMRVTK
eukprot:jgi/Tetstr1/426220/TSEL_016545.t1